VSDELEKMPPAADTRYDDEDADEVARVFVRVEWKGGRIREYEAQEPRDFSINDPEAAFTMTPMGMAVQAAGSPVVPMMAATPSLRLLFRGNPRRPMHIRTERTAAPSRGDESPDDQHRTVRLGKEAITGDSDGESDGSAALGEPGVDLAE
jgi:hypothetical protein